MESTNYYVPPYQRQKSSEPEIGSTRNLPNAGHGNSLADAKKDDWDSLLGGKAARAPGPQEHVFDVDESGRASLDGLYVCGEAAATGLHGANRLASNSLLEGLVFGAKVASAIQADGRTLTDERFRMPVSAQRVGLDDDREAIAAIRRLMWDHVGVMRTGAGLQRALAELAVLAARAGRSAAGRNMAAAAELVATTALAREESRGGHYRLDFPDTDPALEVHTHVTPRPETTVELPALVRGAA